MSDLHDFSQVSKEQVSTSLAQSSETRTPLYWLDDSRFADIVGVIDQERLDIDSYYSELSERAKQSLAAFRLVWTDVSAADQAYAAELRKLTEESRELALEYLAVADLLDGGTQGLLFTGDMQAIQDHLKNIGGMFKDFSVEKEYDLRLQQEVLALLEEEPFNLSVEQWKSLDLSQREALLQLLYEKVQAIMGTQGAPDLIFESLGPKEMGHAISGTVSINTDFLMDDASSVSGNKPRSFQLLFTVIHETRHVYQQETVDDFKNNAPYLVYLRDGPSKAQETVTYSDGATVITRTLPPPDQTTAVPARHLFVGQTTIDYWIENLIDISWTDPYTNKTYTSNYDPHGPNHYDYPVEWDAASFAMQDYHTRNANPTYFGSWGP